MVSPGASGWIVAAVLSLAACQGSRGPDKGSSEPPRDAEPIVHAPEAAVLDAPEASPTDAPTEEPELPDPGKVIADLGAISAWQAVIDRAQLLARRGQHGVVYGRIGPPILIPGPPPPPGDAGPPADAGLVESPFVWLVDDSEGNGCLGIRVALGTKTANQGDRVALGGAWTLDEARRWYWKVDWLQAVPPAPPSDLKEPQPAEPSHAVVTAGLPPGSRTITVAKDGDPVYFTVVGRPPANDGDGWPIANELGDKVYALLILPGERASYGAQDMRSADERWSLRRGWRYAVRIGRIRSRGPDKPAVIRARTAPTRVN